MARPRTPPPAIGDEYAELQARWEREGSAAIRTIAEADPAAYLRLVMFAVASDDNEGT